jgi:hypothetical protein
VPAPDEVVDFVVRMPNGQMLSANVGINSNLSLSSLLGMHRIMSSGVHSTIEFAPTGLFQDPSANYELQPQPGEEEELETEDQSRMQHKLQQRRWPVAAIPRGACDSVFIMPKAKSLSMNVRPSQTVCNIARRQFYDPGCLHTYAFSLRFPSILSRTLFVLGRFHEADHTSGPTNSEHLRRQADGLCSSNTKRLNALFATRGTRSGTFGSIISCHSCFIQSMYINMRTMFRESLPAS